MKILKDSSLTCGAQPSPVQLTSISNGPGRYTGTGVRDMSRGPRPLVTLRDAIPIALQRGMIQLAERGTELLYDFTISGTKRKPVAFVSVKYTERIRATLEDISRDCDDRIRQLRSIARDATVSCELWLHSRYGTWRFFQVTLDGIVEIGRDGKALAAKG